MNGSLFALVDCNAFFVSCERVFQPHLEDKPVIVLSSNDGCAIARSAEAKALGIRMGVPLFKIQSLVEKHGVHVFSSNFSLYSNMSARVMETLRTLAPFLEIYSIDEAFLDLSPLPQEDLLSCAIKIRKRVKQWTGIPVSVGIGPTKTLAKVANHLAKKHPRGCYVLTSPYHIEAALRAFPLEKIWGVGGRLAPKLSTSQIQTALDLACADLKWLRKTFSVVLARTALELRGTSCLGLEELAPPKKSMISSRSFGIPVTSLNTLREAVSTHASTLAQKLRQQKSKTSLLCVKIRTNPFDKQGTYYGNSCLVPLPFPTQNTSPLIKAAISALEKIYKEGLAYKKAGVMVLDLGPENQPHSFLFEEMNEPREIQQKTLLQAIDQLNSRYGKRTLVFASEGLKKPWLPKSVWRSQAFTQSWQYLPKIK